ncbi:hypothetical protein [Persicobacter psychrovividus]|uniref:Uncharacterized protein n=1 Tax=Persicobacter psychrovividus TaxID=387638 RepID=A0ABN6L5C3_9BACT|nr:hypothetical protein PEPS_06200 [Persicobacter psychrovividus]
MDLLFDFVKIILPAALVLYAMYLTTQSFLQKDFEKQLLSLKIKNSEVILPNRLQAYERICLFLERISPHNLLPRVNQSGMSANEFKQILGHEIREELNHNLSQQVYMSDDAWNLVRSTADRLIMLINEEAEKLSPKATSMELAKAVFERMAKEEDYITFALSSVKNEIRSIF